MSKIKPFSVQTFDAFESPPYSGTPLNVGEFATAELALACAKKVIDDQLRSSLEGGLSAEEALGSFESAGEIPMIWGEGEIYLQPFDYARDRVKQLALALNKKYLV